ncbi:MAG: hypothetical protein ABI699_09325 [Caldimonas sp.]
MTDPTRDAFGRLIVSPERLDFRGRVDCLRWLSGHLQADRHLEARWLGAALRIWLEHGGDLAALLGVRPEPGSTLTVQRLIALESRDAERCRAVVVAGGVRAAARAAECSASTVSRARGRRGVARPAVAGAAADDAANNLDGSP